MNPLTEGKKRGQVRVEVYKRKPIGLPPAPKPKRNEYGVLSCSPIWKEVRSFKPLCPECRNDMIRSTHPHWAEYDWVCLGCYCKCKENH